jgi:hypothetical protein
LAAARGTKGAAERFYHVYLGRRDWMADILGGFVDSPVDQEAYALHYFLRHTLLPAGFERLGLSSFPETG